ncbi:MAG: PTS sugar transporter subunit IIC [Eubacterium sp.]
MSVTLLQGLLLALVVFAFAWDARWECFFVFHPIIICFAAGVILGDIPLGLEAGAIAELSYLGLTTVGGTVPPNALIAGMMTVVLAYKSGISAETALGLSLPFALLMQWIVIACQSLFSGFNAKLEQAAKENNMKNYRFYLFLPELILTLLYALVAFLSVYALQDVLSNFVNSFPEFVSHGFEIAGGLLPGLGLALLLKVMLKKDNVPYLIIGFLIMSILKPDNVLPIALFAVALALIDFKRKKSDTVDIGGESDEEGI